MPYSHLLSPVEKKFCFFPPQSFPTAENEATARIELATPTLREWCTATVLSGHDNRNSCDVYLKQNYSLIDSGSMAAWSSGMIPVSGTGGQGFNSPSGPFLPGMKMKTVLAGFRTQVLTPENPF